MGLTERLFPRMDLRESDVLLASFPRSGNTWFRFIWANIVAINDFDGMTVDFEVLEHDLGNEYDAHNYGSLEYGCLPRLVKSHRNYRERAFGGNRSIYLLRHPGDAMVSYYEYLGSRSDEPIAALDFSGFIQSDRYGLTSWRQHVMRWIPHASVFLSYEQLQADAYGHTRRVLEELGETGLDPSVLAEAVERSSFDSLRGFENESWPGADEFDESFRFVRSGRRGEWWDYSSSRDRHYLETVIDGSMLNMLPDQVRESIGI